jgi:hypothetical protein
MHETGLQETSLVREQSTSEDSKTMVLQPRVCGIDEAPSTKQAFALLDSEKKKTGAPSVAHVDVSGLPEDTRIVNSPIASMETDILRPDVLEQSEEDRAADSLTAGDAVALEAWPDIMRATVARALAGNMDAVREIRVGAIEPHRAKVSRRATPKLSALIIDALSRLPVKYTPPVDVIDAEVVETPAPSSDPPSKP